MNVLTSDVASFFVILPPEALILRTLSRAKASVKTDTNGKFPDKYTATSFFANCWVAIFRPTKV